MSIALKGPLLLIVAEAPKVDWAGCALGGRGWDAAAWGPALVRSVLSHLSPRGRVCAVELTAEGRLHSPNSPCSSQPLSLPPSSPRPLTDLLFIWPTAVWRREQPPTPVFLPGKWDRGAWWAAVRGVTKSRIQLSDMCVHTHTHTLALSLTLTTTPNVRGDRVVQRSSLAVMGSAMNPLLLLKSTCLPGIVPFAYMT